MPKMLSSSLLVCAAVLVLPPAAAAQQTLNFHLGYFTVLGEDARAGDDVLLETRGLDVFTFEVSEFNGPTVGAEWLVPIGQFFEGGAGFGFSRRTVPSVYRQFVDTDGSEIEQDFRLRIVPVAFTFRVVPTGQSSPVQPYVGAGLGIFNWRYSESGDFIDFQPGGRRVIFRDEYVESGSQTGALVLGGIRFASDSLSSGFEIRYQRATADLENENFAGSKLDLGGWTYQFTIGLRFR